MSQNPLYINFKNISDDLQQLVLRHKQINSYGLGDTDQMSYWTQLRLKQDNPTFESPFFPLLYVVPGRCMNGLRYKEWELNCIMSDIVDRDLTNQVDVLSDTLQMLQDVMSMYRLSVDSTLGCFNKYYYLDQTIDYTPFLEKYSDLTNGWTAFLKIKTMTALDRCSAAFNEFTGTPITHQSINFKTFHDDFRLLADHHKQLNSFGFGALEDLSYWTESRLKQDNPTYESPFYPLLYVVPGNASTQIDENGSSYTEYDFNCIVMDILDRDLVNQVDVLSDTNQILDDIISQFRLSVTQSLGCFNSKYYLDDMVEMTPFLEEYSDLLGGWNAVLKIKVMEPLDRCAAAFLDFPQPTPTPTPLPTCFTGLTQPCPEYISKTYPSSLYYKDGNIAYKISDLNSCLPGGLAFNSNTNKMFMVDGCSDYYEYDYSITPNGCFSLTLDKKYKLWNTPQFSGSPNATSVMSIYDDNTIIVGNNESFISQTGTTLYLYDINTTQLTPWLQVFDNAKVSTCIYNTANTQSIICYNQASGSTNYYRLYSGATNPVLLAEVTGTSNSGSSIRFSGNTAISVNLAAIQWVLDFQNGTATPITNGPIPVQYFEWADEDPIFSNCAEIVQPASCYNFDIAYQPNPTPTPSPI